MFNLANSITSRYTYHTASGAARIIGRKMKSILELNKKLYEKIIRVLDVVILEKPKEGNTEIIIAQNMNKSPKEVQVILKGIEEETPFK